MIDLPLYPLRFEPIFQYRLWGGRRLSGLLKTPLPGDGPIGEAWILSDRPDHASLIADGPLKGRTLTELMGQAKEPLLGNSAGRFPRFPLLLKFLDANDVLSVQVHPSDAQKEFLPPVESCKTEAWVVLEAGAESRIYAGLKPGTTRDELRKSVADKTLERDLSWFGPKPDEAVLIKSGTVHTLKDVVVFEVQENSDVTFRLYDWDRIDAKTGRPRDLQVDQAIACVDFDQTALGPVSPSVEVTVPVLRERLLVCDQFKVWRHRGDATFKVGAPNVARVLVCLSGDGFIDRDGEKYPLSQGQVSILPAVVGECAFRPRGSVNLLEVSLPE
ncbi:MAG: class I mannose-6-phosphate isomerase [Isosphaeraceae bacterium]